MISFGVKYWFVLLLVLLVAATGIVLLLYFRNKENRELTKGQRNLLMVLRFFSFGLIAFLLLSPFLKSLKKMVQNPLVVTAWDNSGSMIAPGDSVMIASEILALKDKLTEEIGKEYTLVNYSFGQETTPDGALDFSGKRSDYSQLVSDLANNYFNENVGALILAGDGIYNQGKSPVNMLEDIPFPVFTIGLGDTTEVTDSRIQGIRVNRTAFSGNRFPVEIDSRYSKLKGRPLKLTVHEEGTEVAQTIVTPPNNDFFHSHQFILEAGTPGLKKFTVSVETAENEKNIKNNTTTFVINVLENKQKILILSDGPHPDIGVVKNTLEQQKSYEISVFTEEPYPSNLSDFNLIILNQLPTSGISMAGIIGNEANQRVPLLFIVGDKTFIPQLNALSTGVTIQPLAGLAEEAQAVINPAYATFSLSESFREVLPKFPPLLAPFANYSLDPGLSPLLFQKVKNIETGKPLLATGMLNGRKTGFLLGEGIWRWRLNNYFQNQSHIQFDELINQLVQYLALRQNEDNFIMDYEPVYAETDHVVLNAEVYNDAFERITSEEVTVVIENEQGDELDFTFDVRGDSYQLDAGNLSVGNYSFTAEVTVGSETYTESGNFAVTAVNIENIVTQANHRMLYQLAVQSGGSFYPPSQAEQIIGDLKSSNTLKPVIRFQEMINELLNLRWLFFVLLLLLSVEWFLRKFWGIY
ncbi:hypothetical protein [Mariniphaga sediminis]|uniref:hypothetical protein n=1 Tax=Mariniphaga sediminis TaxID=1628158 RepID=UPI0011C3C0E1|nr:hypothetical protein [Mariniphaga sediminis]